MFWAYDLGNQVVVCMLNSMKLRCPIFKDGFRNIV